MAQPYMYPTPMKTLEPGDPNMIQVMLEVAKAMRTGVNTEASNAWDGVLSGAKQAGQVLQKDPSGLDWAKPGLDAVTEASNAARGAIGDAAWQGLNQLDHMIYSPEYQPTRDWFSGLPRRGLEGLGNALSTPEANATRDNMLQGMQQAAASLGVSVQQLMQQIGMTEAEALPQATQAPQSGSQSFPLSPVPQPPAGPSPFQRTMNWLNTSSPEESQEFPVSVPKSGVNTGGALWDQRLGKTPGLVDSVLSYFGIGVPEAEPKIDPTTGLPQATADLDSKLAAAMMGRFGGLGMGGMGGASSPIAGSAPMPMDMFEEAVPGAVAPPNYMGLSKYLHQPQRIQRGVAPGQDWSETDEAYAAARPDAPEHEGPWDGILSGLGQAALSYGAGGVPNTGALLLALGGGAMAGYERGKANNRALDRGFAKDTDEYELNRAQYEATKGQARRAETQQGLDAGYEADVDYDRQMDAHGAALAQLGAKGLDADYQYRQAAETSRAAQKNSHLKAQAAWLDQFKPEFKMMPNGGIMIVEPDPETGQKRVRVDMSSVMEAARAKALFGAMGGGDEDHDLDKLYGPGPGSMSSYQPIWELALQAAQSPQLAQQILGDRLQPLMQSATQASLGDGDMMARYLGNNIYTELMNMRVQQPEVMEEFLRQYGLLGAQ